MVSKDFLKSSGLNQEDTYEKLALTDITVKDQVRKNFEGINELAKSIFSLGLQNPLVVELGKEGYVLNQGERRYRALTLLVDQGHDEFGLVDCRIVNADDAIVSFLRQLAENSARDDLTALEYAESYIHFRDHFDSARGWQTRLAEQSGVSKSFISRHLALHEASNEVKKLAESGLVKSVQALLKIERSEHKDKLIKLIEEGSGLNEAWFVVLNQYQDPSSTVPKNTSGSKDSKSTQNDLVNEEPQNSNPKKGYNKKDIETMAEYIMLENDIKDHSELLGFLNHWRETAR